MNLDGSFAIRAGRIHVISGPGAGKSSLTRCLASKLGTEAHKLDDIAFDPRTGTARPPCLRIRDINFIAARSAWVAEGVYLGWTDLLMALADLIAWLDHPMCVALLRKIPHNLKRSLIGGYPNAGMRNRLEHALFVWRYYMSSGGEAAVSPQDDRMVTREATARALESFEHKVVRCRTTDQIDTLCCRIE